MTGEFTEAHKALVEKIAADVVKRALVDGNLLTRAEVKRREKAEGVLTVPDDQVTADIARRVVDNWAKEQPKWWDVRRRLDAMLVGGGLAALVGYGIYDAVIKDWTHVPRAIHWVVGIDKLVERQLIGVLTDWGADRTSPVTEAFNTAFETRLARWSKSEDFGRRSKDALTTLAQQTGANDNPLLGFVKQALKANPLLMFHQQGVLGNSLPVQISDSGCEKLFIYWYNKQKKTLPVEIVQKEYADALRETCSPVAEMRQGKTIEVPFFARFHEDETGVRDKVMLVLHVRRFKREKPELLDGPAPSEADRSELVEVHGFATLKGLVIEYHSTNENLLRDDRDTVRIPYEALPTKGNRFHAGFIDDTVRAVLEAHPTGQDAQDLIHSISISLPDDHDNSEIVQVRMMVMVNKDVF